MSAKCLNKLILKQHICILNRGVNLKLYNISSFEIFSSKCVKKLNFKSISSVLKFRPCRHIIASCQIDRARICQIKGLLFKVQILPYSLLLLHGPAFVSGFWNRGDSVPKQWWSRKLLYSYTLYLRFTYNSKINHKGSFIAISGHQTWWHPMKNISAMPWCF